MLFFINHTQSDNKQGSILLPVPTIKFPEGPGSFVMRFWWTCWFLWIFIKFRLGNLWISLRTFVLQIWQILVSCGWELVKSSRVRYHAVLYRNHCLLLGIGMYIFTKAYLLCWSHYALLCRFLYLDSVWSDKCHSLDNAAAYIHSKNLL